MTLLVRLFIIGSLFLNTTIVFSQETVIQIVHKNGHRVRTVKEGSIIKVRTLDENKIKGRFEIVNPGTIKIDGELISLSNIKSIRRKPLAVKIVKGFFITIGASAIAIPLIIGSGGIAITAGVGVAVYANLIGFTVPEFFVQTRAKPKWSFSIMDQARR